MKVSVNNDTCGKLMFKEYVCCCCWSWIFNSNPHSLRNHVLFTITPTSGTFLDRYYTWQQSVLQPFNAWLCNLHILFWLEQRRLADQVLDQVWASRGSSQTDCFWQCSRKRLTCSRTAINKHVSYFKRVCPQFVDLLVCPAVWMQRR